MLFWFVRSYQGAVYRDAARFAEAGAAPRSDMRETSLGQQVQVFGFGQRAADAFRPFGGVLLQAGGQRGFGDHITHLQPPAGAQHAKGLAEYLSFVF